MRKTGKKKASKNTVKKKNGRVLRNSKFAQLQDATEAGDIGGVSVCSYVCRSLAWKCRTVKMHTAVKIPSVWFCTQKSVWYSDSLFEGSLVHCSNHFTGHVARSS